MTNQEIQKIVEGLLFVYGEEGIALNDINQVLPDTSTNAIKQAIIDLEKKYYSDESSPFAIQKYGNGKYRLHTKEELYPYFVKLEEIEENTKLSTSAIEVLSIIAYKAPIAKSEIDSIRGTDCSYQIYRLKERHLIRSTGKTQSGANLYAITENFYKLFNLKGGIDLLPKISNDELEEMSRQVEEKHEKEKNKSTDIFETNTPQDNGILD